jgi:D-inositol-3-phosphate glycosyltransferase
LNSEPAAQGSLDSPRAGEARERGALTVSGWVHFPSGATSRVEVHAGERFLGLAQAGVSRFDVTEQLARPEAALAGFTLSVDTTAWPMDDGPVDLRIVAESVTGETLELPPTAFELRTPEPAPAILPLPAPRAQPGAARRLLVFTHQLCLGGASKFLLELLRELIAQGAAEPVVVSAIGGPLQAELDEAGIEVHVNGGAPLDDARAHRSSVAETAAWAAPQGFELALLNTASPLVFSGASVAAELGIPAIWAIHESFEPNVLWSSCDPKVRALGREMLESAHLAVFEAEATRVIYEPYLGERAITVPYGLDLAPIDALRDGFDRQAERRRLGIPEETRLIVCVGTIEPRKAQAQLAQAFDLVADRHPNAQLALLGASDTVDSQALSSWVDSSSRSRRIRIVPTTPEIMSWYGVSDLLVCASRIESLPRAVLEAMAWELPVLATDVFGLPELIEDGMNGWLCAAGDTAKLSAALDRVLGSNDVERLRIGRAGRETVERDHRIDSYARKIGSLISVTT